MCGFFVFCFLSFSCYYFFRLGSATPPAPLARRQGRHGQRPEKGGGAFPPPIPLPAPPPDSDFWIPAVQKFCSKKVRAAFRICDQVKLPEFFNEFCPAKRDGAAAGISEFPFRKARICHGATQSHATFRSRKRRFGPAVAGRTRMCTSNLF